MTVVNFDLQEPGASGSTPASGRVNFRQTERKVDGSVLVLPGIFTVELVAGKAAANLDPGVYFVEEKSPYGESAFRLVPAVGPVDYASLVAVDPATLVPTAAPDPAWEAMARSTVVSGTVVDGELVLSRTDGSSFVAGNVRGTPGTPGAPGIRGTRWYVSKVGTPDYSDVTDMIHGDIFLYPTSRDFFMFENGAWVYAGLLGA